MKKCTKCKIDKEFSDFYKCSIKKNKSGYRSQCISCEKNYLILNKELIKERNKKYNIDNKDRKSLNGKNYYLKNKELLKEKARNQYNNKDKKLEYQKKYQQENKERRNIYLTERRKNDPLFKLITNVRNLIYNSFYYNGYSKDSKTEELLGCTFKELKEYLESKFEPWMNWDNRGLYDGEFNTGWDIDHIIPLSSVDTENDIIKLNHFSNLQPLCSKINRDIKKNNLEYEFI